MNTESNIDNPCTKSGFITTIPLGSGHIRWPELLKTVAHAELREVMLANSPMSIFGNPSKIQQSPGAA